MGPGGRTRPDSFLNPTVQRGGVRARCGGWGMGGAAGKEYLTRLPSGDSMGLPGVSWSRGLDQQ